MFATSRSSNCFILDPFDEALGAALLVLRPYVLDAHLAAVRFDLLRMLLSICLIWSSARARGGSTR